MVEENWFWENSVERTQQQEPDSRLEYLEFKPLCENYLQ